jgi:hypothetical protein
MRKELGASAGILALLALVLHTQFQSPSETVVSHRSETTPNRNKNDHQPPSEAVEGPWLATGAFFHDTRVPQFPCDSTNPGCLYSRDGVPDRKTLRALMGIDGGQGEAFSLWTVVASVADPAHTRLPLFLDRQIEAIQRALQNLDWQFAGQWLPWLDTLEPHEGDISEHRRQRELQRVQENLPGVLIFRPSPPILPDRLLTFSGTRGAGYTPVGGELAVMPQRRLNEPVTAVIQPG